MSGDSSTTETPTDEAVTALAAHWWGREVATDAMELASRSVKAIGPAIERQQREAVAAELRRLADEDAFELGRLRHTASLYSNGLPPALQPMFDRYHASMMRLRARADELDPQA